MTNVSRFILAVLNLTFYSKNQFFTIQPKKNTIQ